MWAGVDHRLIHSVIDDASDQWCRSLHACLQATGEHFEYDTY